MSGEELHIEAMPPKQRITRDLGTTAVDSSLLKESVTTEMRERDDRISEVNEEERPNGVRRRRLFPNRHDIGWVLDELRRLDRS